MTILGQRGKAALVHRTVPQDLLAFSYLSMHSTSSFIPCAVANLNESPVALFEKVDLISKVVSRVNR